MLFLPLRADLDHFRFPFITLLVCILCLGIYYGQYHNEKKVIDGGQAFCESRGAVMWRMVMEKSMGEASFGACAEMMWTIHLADDPDAEIRKFAEQGDTFPGLDKAQSDEFKRYEIADRYRAFTNAVPKYETQQLWYQPHSWDVWNMVTSTFAHGSWLHVIGNLFFFVAFAATVEVMVGTLLYTAILGVLSLGTNVFYSIAMLAVPDALPTVGLSGVVMGMMALFTFFLPNGKIKCLLWFLIIVRIISVPAWLLVLWFVGWDVYDLLVLADDRSGINLVAHVSGAGIGYLLGVAFFRERRREVQAMV